MLVVDSQIHLWGSNLPTNPAHRQITSYSAQDALRGMAEAGVDAAVIHPPGWDPDSDAIAVEAASQHPDKFAILGKFPLDDPASAALIDGWKQQSGMLGLRFTFLQPISRHGPWMERWTGSGLQPSKRGCPWDLPALVSCLWLDRWPSVILVSSSS